MGAPWRHKGASMTAPLLDSATARAALEGVMAGGEYDEDWRERERDAGEWEYVPFVS